MKPLLKYAGSFWRGEIVDRPNRFTLRLRMGPSIERVYLPNPGRLSTVLSPGRKILCEKCISSARKTHFNAFAVRVHRFYVTVNSSFANAIFSAAVEGGALKEFEGCEIASREKQFKDGRIDFVLRSPQGEEIYVEVKSCTHVEQGTAKFPDRPTERGRRHLAILSKLAEGGARCYVVFVVQRPDARAFEPFREVDPKFADMLREAVEKGVKVRAISTEFRPPNLYLRKNLPISMT